MGITIAEMLKLNYFKDFKVIAGHRGTDKQIQGVAILDAPDGFEWTRGKELVVSSGYIFHQRPDMFEKYVKDGKIDKISGMGIKIDRYIKKIPDHIVEAFEEKGIPLISIPNEPAWMDIVNQLNVLVMNKSIKRFKIGSVNPKNYSNLTYQSRKIDMILSQIENEMDFPAMLYDLSAEKCYSSSSKFKEVSQRMNIENFWNPSFLHSKEVLCDNLNITRYTMTDEKCSMPCNWISVPITVGEEIKAYFIVFEAAGKIDYFDQFGLRIGFLLLQSLYEQILVAQSIKDSGFEKFVSEILAGDLTSSEMVTKRAVEIGFDTTRRNILTVAKQIKGNIPLSTYRDELQTIAINSIRKIEGRAALIKDDLCVLAFPVNEKISIKSNLDAVMKSLTELEEKLKSKDKSIELLFGVSDIPDTLPEIKRNFDRALQAIKVGKIIYPEKRSILYSELGAFAWIDIKEDEVAIMLRGIEKLIESDQDGELMKTLRIYLECKMNYSLTAKQTFLHINTVRKRITKISELISFDLEDSINRLKLEIILKLLSK